MKTPAYAGHRMEVAYPGLTINDLIDSFQRTHTQIPKQNPLRDWLREIPSAKAKSYTTCTFPAKDVESVFRPFRFGAKQEEYKSSIAFTGAEETDITVYLYLPARQDKERIRMGVAVPFAELTYKLEELDFALNYLEKYPESNLIDTIIDLGMNSELAGARGRYICKEMPRKEKDIIQAQEREYRIFLQQTISWYTTMTRMVDRLFRVPIMRTTNMSDKPFTLYCGKITEIAFDLEPDLFTTIVSLPPRPVEQILDSFSFERLRHLTKPWSKKFLHAPWDPGEQKWTPKENDGGTALEEE